MATTLVALTTITMCCIPKNRMGNATGLFNMIRNLGGSFGIAVTTTLLARRGQFHQNRLIEHLTPYALPFSHWQQQMADRFQSRGDYWELWDTRGSLAELYKQMHIQAWMKSFCEIYWIFTLIFLALIPLALLMRHEPPPLQCPAEEPPGEIQGVN